MITQSSAVGKVLSSGHRTGKVQLSFQCQRRGMSKNVQTTTKLHSSHMQAKLKIHQSRLQQYMNCELPDVQADLEKAEEPEIKLSTSFGSSKKQESSRNTSTSTLLTTPKPLTVWITTNCGKFLNTWE